MDLRLRAKSANLADAALNARLDELEKTVAADIVDANKKLLARDAEKSMRYQVWALNQIKQVRTYSAIKEFEVKRAELDEFNSWVTPLECAWYLGPL